MVNGHSPDYQVCSDKDNGKKRMVFLTQCSKPLCLVFKFSLVRAIESGAPKFRIIITVAVLVVFKYSFIFEYLLRDLKNMSRYYLSGK